MERAWGGEAPLWFEVHDDVTVEQAIAGLSQVDLSRLEEMADAWITRFYLDDADRGFRDLLSEALVRTLDGRRGWRKGVELSYHLNQTMRSIAGSWRKAQARRTATAGRQVRESDLPPAPGDTRSNLLDETAGSDGKEAESRLIERQGVEAVEAHFAGDTQVLAVISGWLEGHKGPEIQARAGMSEKQYQTAVRRLRRNAPRGGTGHAH